jgi:hypothetical protein
MKTKVFTVCAVVFLFCSIVNAGINDGLVAYYPFNGNANDESGNGNNGVIHGSALTADRLGKLNSAYNFDGVDDYLQISNSGSLNFGTSDFTISCWINTDIYPSYPVALIDKRTSPARGFVLYYNEVFGKTGIQLGNGSAYINFNSQNTYSLQSNNWIHLLVSVDRNSSTGMKLYINGQLKDTFDPTSVPGTLDNLGDLLIGKNSISSSFPYFKGKMDDIRIYNRALSASEIQQLYQGSPCSDEVAVKPYTFTSGTPAKAAEINANFDVLYQRVNSPRCTN